MSFGIRLVVTIAFMALLLVASIIPGRAQHGDSVLIRMVAATPTLLQKIMHVALYALLALLWIWTLEAIESVHARLLAALVIAVGYGGALEWSQTRSPGRFGTVTDVFLNAAGAIMGVLAAVLLL